MLPVAVAPWLELVRCKPASDGTGSNPCDQTQGHQFGGNLGQAPAAARFSFLFRKTAGQGCSFCPHFRGKNASALQAAADPPDSCSPPNDVARCAPPGRCTPHHGQSVDCSNPGGHGRPAQSWHASPFCGGFPGADQLAVHTLRFQGTVSDTWALDLV